MSESTAVELVADAHAIVGEGPVWDASTGLLVWVDIEGKSIYEFDPATGVNREIEVPQYPGAVVRRASGGYMAAVTNGFASVDRDGRFELVVPVEADLPENRMNDGKCDPQGPVLGRHDAHDPRRPDRRAPPAGHRPVAASHGR